MNKRQKTILLLFSSLSALLIAAWGIFSREIFTKTQILIEKKDELFGWTEKEWVDKFIPGLDLTLGAILILGIVSLILILFSRTPKNRK